MIPIDIEHELYYDRGKPELRERTRNRLIKMKEVGMEAYHNYQFGYEGVMSGLWIERVWGFSEERWNKYMKWATDLIKEKTDEATKVS